MKKVIRLTESDLIRIVKKVLSEGVSQNNFKVGQKFEEIHNRQYIMAKGYSTAAIGGGANNYNDFTFRRPEVVEVSNNMVKFRLDYGDYNPNDIWKEGQKDLFLNKFCLSVPYDKIQEIKQSQVMISIPNSLMKSYIKTPC